MQFFRPEWIEAWNQLRKADWFVQVTSVLVIIAGTLVIWALVKRAARRARRRFDEIRSNLGDDDDPRALISAAQRITALQLVVNAARYVVFATAVLLILSHLNLLQSNSLLLPAGFLGAALGLGAQNLVRDVVSGLFIVFEGQFAVGDYVKINGIAGRVVEVGLRVTRVLDETGQVHFFPNGAITTVVRAPRHATELWLWVPVPQDVTREQVTEVVQSAIDDFDAVFDVWNVKPKVLETEGFANRVRLALRVQAAQTSLVRDKLPARVTSALEAAGIKNTTGAAVELTAAPTSS